ncbi:MAG: hypothetical protein M3O74_06735 [Pseudomonadota bacterium]|nr:hypothetical protein [Pseudomonadota bacterium]
MSIADSIAKLGPVMIAIYVAWLGRQQFEATRQKLRLDLYDRRFAIYAATLDWYQALLSGPQIRADLREVQRDFIKAVRESRFLFGADSTIVEILDDMNKRSFRILGFRDSQGIAKADPELYQRLFKQQADDVQWFGSASGMQALEKEMMPFLDFRRVGGLSRSIH